MPVATSTMTNNSIANGTTSQSLKSAAKTPEADSGMVKTADSSPRTPDSKRGRALEKIYNRAARAFLNRNVKLTHELLDAGFTSLEASASSSAIMRKWDILRITFDTMLYTSSPVDAKSQTNDIPSLEALLSKVPQRFVEDMYTRSLELFRTGNDDVRLPSQVISTLVYSSLKTDVPDVGRRIIEEWLAQRGEESDLSSSWMSSSSASSMGNSTMDGYDADGSVNGDSGDSALVGGDGYAKILELYCTQVLPKLEQWEYAAEFLEYESELDGDQRENLKRSLQSLHAQAISSRLPSSSISPTFASSLSAPEYSYSARAYSPAPSTSSSSSSLSTTSNHTIVPATPRARASLQALHSPSGAMSPLLSPMPASGDGSVEGSDGTITPRQRRTDARPRTQGRSDSSKGKGKQKARNFPPASTPPSAHNVHPLNPNALTPLSLPRTHLNSSSSASHRTPNLSTLALIKASMAPYLGHLTGATSGNKIGTAVILFVVVPVLSLLVRMLRRRQRLPLSSRSAGGSVSADLVRQRLQAARTSASGMGVLGRMLANAWWEIIRVVLDTVKMAGSGLV